MTTTIDHDGLPSEYLRTRLLSLGDDTFAGIVRTSEMPVPVLRSIITELLSLRSSPAVDGVGEPVAWGYVGYDGLWVATRIKELADAFRGVGIEVTPLYTRSALSPTSDSASVVEAPTHRHVKRGTEYVLIGYGKMQAQKWKAPTIKTDADGERYTHVSIDMREVAIYRSVDDGSLWVRPREEFEDGRFEALSPRSS